MPLCFISIGSNINRAHNISSALDALHRELGPLKHSSIYESASVGFAGDAFYNLVSAFHCDERACHIARQLKNIEAEHGRVRSTKKFSARTLDIDLLLYGQKIINTKSLSIPHKDILNYAFVLEPLVEIAPEYQHPVNKRNYAQLWSDFDKSNLQQRKVSRPLNIQNGELYRLGGW